MRRSAAAAALFLALAAPAASTAGARGGNLQLKVPAPALGKATVQVLTLHVKAPGKVPKLKLKITNLAALGKGFDAVATVSGPKSQGSNVTLKVVIVMFMGNLSSSPASTINLQTNLPAGEVKSSEKNATKDCATINSVYELDKAGFYFLVAHIGEGESPPGSFMHNTTSYLCPK